MVAISVLIRSRNEVRYLRPTLAALAAQTRPHQVVLVEDHSTDGSVELARKHGAVVVSLDRFTYGYGLNRGLEACTGDVVVILSGHSIPVGPHFLEECARPFEADPNVGGVRLVYAGKGVDATR